MQSPGMILIINNFPVIKTKGKTCLSCTARQMLLDFFWTFDKIIVAIMALPSMCQIPFLAPYFFKSSMKTKMNKRRIKTKNKLFYVESWLINNVNWNIILSFSNV